MSAAGAIFCFLMSLGVATFTEARGREAEWLRGLMIVVFYVVGAVLLEA